MGDWRADRVGAALRGENPLVIARMRRGFAVIGDTQQLPGYCVLLTDDPAADHLTDLERPARGEFLFDLSLLGEAVAAACGLLDGFRRINYEVLGNSLPFLHGHVHARYDWEPPELVGGPVWRYGDERDAPEHAYDDARDGELRTAIGRELQRVMREAY